MTKPKPLWINALLNIVKQICTVIFPMITFPYVSRVLGVEAYGKVNTGVSLIGYIGLIAGLGVQSYAIREGAKIREDKKRFQLFTNEVFSINILSTLASFIVLAIAILTWNKIAPYKSIMVILSINILLSTLGTDWINAVFEDFLYLTIRYIACQTVAVCLTFLFVRSPEDILIYAFVSNLGTTSANLLNIFYIRKKLKIFPRFIVHMNPKQHLKPILILFGNMISTMIYLFSDTSMLGLIVGDIAVGYYTVASKLYSIIKQTLNSIAAVATPRFSNQLKDKKIQDIEKQANALLGVLILFLIPAVVGMICVGRDLIILMSGKEYENGVSALNILSITLIFSTVAGLFVGVVMLSFGKDKEILIASTISAAINVILNLILIPIFSYDAAAFTTLISEMVMMIIGFWNTRKLIKIKVTKFVGIGALGGVWVFAACWIVGLFHIENLVIRLVASVLLSVSLYGILLLVVFKPIKKR